MYVYNWLLGPLSVNMLWFNPNNGYKEGRGFDTYVLTLVSEPQRQNQGSWAQVENDAPAGVPAGQQLS